MEQHFCIDTRRWHTPGGGKNVCDIGIGECVHFEYQLGETINIAPKYKCDCIISDVKSIVQTVGWLPNQQTLSHAKFIYIAPLSPFSIVFAWMPVNHK